MLLVSARRAILALPTVDGVLVGPSDLSMRRARGAYRRSPEDFADAEPTPAAFYKQWLYEPGRCEDGEGVAGDGTLIWGGGDARYVYVLAADHWGRGFATEAATAIRDYAFNVLELDRLVALVDPEHAASESVATKVGMTFDRDTLRPNGKWLRVYQIAGE